MKILITGAKGQLGNKIIEKLGGRHQLILTDSQEMDITDADTVKKVLAAEKPGIIFHCAAYTRVDQAEEEKELVYKINASGTENIAKVAAALGIPVLYISTDFVFGRNDGEPLREDDPTDPLSVYGQTKLDGENFIRKYCDKHYIIRVAWLFGELPKNHPGSNFVETMLRLAEERDSLSVIDDQKGSPTYTGDLVDLMQFLIDQNPAYGTYHFSGEGETSWYGFAKEIFVQSGVDIALKPITTAEYPAKAVRPSYSYLSKDKIRKAGFKVRRWQEMLKEYLTNRGQ